MKKVLSISLMVLLLISTLSVTVFAGGHHGKGRNSAQKNTVEQQTVHQTRFEICETEDCDIAGPHQHDDTWYCSQSYLQDGLGLCPVDSCTVRGIHEHDEIYYHCAYYGTGLGCGNNGAKRHCR